MLDAVELCKPHKVPAVAVPCCDFGEFYLLNHRLARACQHVALPSVGDSGRWNRAEFDVSGTAHCDQRKIGAHT